jgi:hypothetical protein
MHHLQPPIAHENASSMLARSPSNVGSARNWRPPRSLLPGPTRPAEPQPVQWQLRRQREAPAALHNRGSITALIKRAARSKHARIDRSDRLCVLTDVAIHEIMRREPAALA